MQPRASVSFPSSFEDSGGVRVVVGRGLVRLALVVWVAVVYIAYWLGQRPGSH
jgi:hypothetical protein